MYVKLEYPDTGKALQELLLDICHIWSWTFDYEFNLIRTNSISPNLFTKIMLEEKHREVLALSRPGDKPLILSNTMGLMFSAVFGEKDIWFLGPVYTVEVNDSGKDQKDIFDCRDSIIPPAFHHCPGSSLLL